MDIVEAASSRLNVDLAKSEYPLPTPGRQRLSNAPHRQGGLPLTCALSPATGAPCQGRGEGVRGHVLNHRLWKMFSGKKERSGSGFQPLEFGKGTWRIFFVPLLIMIAGCMVSPKEKAGGILQKDKLHRIKRVAVLPFYNLSDRLDAEVIVTNLFIDEIVHDRRFQVVKYGDIQEFLWQQKVQSTDTVTKETLKGLADRFSVEGVVLGTINTYREWGPDLKEYAIAEISARLVDCETGQTVWFGREKRTGQDERTVFDFGEIKFCSQLVRRVAKDFLTVF